MINDHPVENLMRSTMENLRDMIDVNTVIGDTVRMDNGTAIIPISKVSFGFASGGSDFTINNEEKREGKYPFGGGSGAGVSVKPVAFLIVRDNSVRLMPVDQDNTYDRIVDTILQVLDMFKDMFNKKDKNTEENSTASEQMSFDDNKYDYAASSINLDNNKYECDTTSIHLND